jgi:N-acetylglutamate synthase-like GNAT family acetyltransferase
LGAGHQTLGFGSTIKKLITMRHIRRATKEDSDSIADLYRELVADSPISVLPERVDALAKSDQTFLLVCDDEGDIIATALLCLCQDVMYNNQPFAIVENVIVHSQYQREGIGKSMMDYIEDFCLQQDCSKIMLLTSNENRNARDFYTAMGYDPDAKIGFVKYRKYFGH